MDVPEIRTARLTLRPPCLEDFAESAAMWGDPEVTRYIGGQPSNEEQCWARLHRYVGHWALLGYGFWTARERASGRFVGEVGVADFRREMVPRLDAPEVGWALARWAHGQGFATEGVQAAIAWAKRHLGAPAMACIIDPGNVASIRVAEKCGFRERMRATYKGEQTIIFERPAG